MCKPKDNALIRRLCFVAFFLEIGLLLLVLPWSAFWEHNYFAATFPWLLSVLTNNFVRGGVSGLGVVNLAAGLTDLAGLLAVPRRMSSASGDRPSRPH